MSDEPDAFSNLFDRTLIQQLIQANTVNMAAPAPGRPQEGPPLPRHWVDRDDDLRQVGGLLTDAAPVVVTGPAGIGKSSLAAMLAGLLAERFPDGQLYIDLGADDPKSAMRSALPRLGVPKDFIADTLGGMVSQYRTATSDKAILVIVDEAPDRETGLQFAPASRSAGFLLIGHSWPDDLDVVRHELRALPADESTDLLARICPELTETEAARYIAAIDWSPAKVRALAGFIRTLGRAEAAHETTQRAIAEYSTTELITATGRMLSADASWLHGLLLRLPGNGFDAGLLVVLDAEEAFAELGEAQLATQVAPGRHRIEGTTETADLPIRYRDAMRETVSWYRERAQSADADVMGDRMRLAGLDPTLNARMGTANAEPIAKHTGMRWLRDNRRTLAGLVRIADAAGWSDECCAIAEALWALFTNEPRPEEAAVCYRTAAEAAAGPIAKARMLILLGRVLIDLPDHAESEAVLQSAVTTATIVGGETGQTLACSALEQLGWLYYCQKRFKRAASTYLSALDIARRLGRERSQALLHKLLGLVYRDQRRSEEAAREFRSALPVFERRGDERNIAVVGFELAALALAAEDRSALPTAVKSIDLMRRKELDRAAAESMERLGTLLDGSDARRWLEAALEVFEHFSDSDADRVRAKLG